jgi:hypothetical protein
MTIGIYSLYWWEQDLVYIGQSQNIEERLRQHINSLKRGSHYNYKLQKSYNNYGTPTSYVLEECSIDRLLPLELCWCKEFNALSPSVGLNIAEPGVVGSGTGTNHGSSKYSRITVLRVFSLLYKTELALGVIASITITNTNIHLAGHIKSGFSHLWLKDSYPKQYLLMQNRVNSSNIGQFHRNSFKHSKITILRIFSLLYRTNLSMKRIGEITNTNEKLVSHIKCGDRHTWVHNSYPEQCKVMRSIRPNILRSIKN